MTNKANLTLKQRLPPKKSSAGPSLQLAAFIKILPPDYMIHIVYKGKEKWSGITWVFMYDSVFTRFLDYGVVGFRLDYYNIEAVIEIDRV